MIKEYDQVTAHHYAAFRPVLHGTVLSKCLDGRAKYHFGLDVGCGTGQSSIALAAYCKKVFGIEPSRDMLKKAIPNKDVEYLHYIGSDLAFENDDFDIITFAGSLYYAKSQELLTEIIRVSRPSAIIVVYDFEVLVKSILEKFDLEFKRKSAITYNHQEDFSGLEYKGLEFIKKQQEATSILINPNQLAHLLLSAKDQYESLKDVLGPTNLYEKTVNKLNDLSHKPDFNVDVNLYYTTYTCLKV